MRRSSLNGLFCVLAWVSLPAVGGLGASIGIESRAGVGGPGWGLVMIGTIVAIASTVSDIQGHAVKA